MTQLPVFETSRLILRDITERDATAYERYFIDYEVIGTMSHIVPWPYPRNGVLEYIRAIVIPNQCMDQWVWGICLKPAPDELIGAIWLKRKGMPSNRGFWLGKKFWGKGMMTEAVKPITDYAFDVLGFEKLVLANAVGNPASRRIKEKTGAVFLRTEPAIYVNPSYTEREVWELTKECWKAFKNFKGLYRNVKPVKCPEHLPGNPGFIDAGCARGPAAPKLPARMSLETV